MKVQTLNENLIKALTGIKENRVNICNVIVNRKPLLEALKINSKFGKIILETGKLKQRENNYKDQSCLRISLDHTVMTLYHQDTYDNKCLNPAKLDFTCSTNKQGLAVDTSKFIEALVFSLSCCATTQDRPVLACVLFDSNNGTLKLVGADGFRLGIAKLDIQGLTQNKYLLEATDINKKLLPFLKTIKSDSYKIGKEKRKVYDDFHMEVLEKSVKFYNGQGVLELEKVEGNYPDYEKLIPDSSQSRIEFIAHDLYEATKSIAITSRDSTGIVRLKFSKVDDTTGKITLSSKSEEVGDSSTNVDAKIGFNNDADYSKRIALNQKYLLDFLKHYKHETITGKLIGDTYSMTFESESRIFVIMPISVQW